ncbi:DNA-binding transcriptional regulator, LysR family [Abditibacterium utsteinense]|uniref:DNA-binding transcriptional regulator, LysR family n=1 Tax=Abditibacterium utsteinense TaxID=1960156 RepID=A0A2S8SR59_9BACT|nr:LysR family transcriptional regulator [Abditibacterium utsteinense]PQV63294.1 DNA-binding transcriptional regulator, LysR family [Abditibacterium utsteinense]
MSHLEWYRNFIAVYRAGSVSEAAKLRHLTQPAVSQQLAALETAVGVPLFVRTPKGMQPTARGDALYHQVFDALDKLDRVSRSLRGRDVESAMQSVRIGAPPEYFHAFALERLGGAGFELVVRFGDDKELLSMLEVGALDVAITTQKPSAKSLQHRSLAPKHFALVGPPHLEPPASDLGRDELASWLGAQPWVSYSQELPITRRFWQQHLHTRFEGKLSVVAPDLRAVLRAVELGYGISILPDFLCRDALAAARVRHIWPVRHLIQGEQWILSFREVDSDRPEIIHIGDTLITEEEVDAP